MRTTMRAMLPDSAAFTIKRRGRRASWTYTEAVVGPKRAAVLARTVDMMKSLAASMGGIEVDDSVPGRVTLQGETDFSVAADAVVGEFLCWSHFGAISIGDLFVSVGAARATAAAASAAVADVLNGLKKSVKKARRRGASEST